MFPPSFLSLLLTDITHRSTVQAITGEGYPKTGMRTLRARIPVFGLLQDILRKVSY
jgi:hypothetical protein